METLIATEYADLEVAEDLLIAVTGMLVGNTLELFQNDILPNRDRTLAEYDLATYTGYAAEAITYAAPSRADTGEIEVLGMAGEFRPTASTVGNNIYGGLVLDGAGNLLFAFRFDDAPLPMASTLDAILCTLRIRVPAGGFNVTVS